jgi:hypothetical protein
LAEAITTFARMIGDGKIDAAAMPITGADRGKVIASLHENNIRLNMPAKLPLSCHKSCAAARLLRRWALVFPSNRPETRGFPS